MQEIINLMKDLGLEPVIIRIPGEPKDGDIDKNYLNYLKNTPECIAYRRIRSIANSNANEVNFHKAMQCLSEDVETISKCIETNTLNCPHELKEFVENCCAIYSAWDDKYRAAFNSIKDYRDNVKKEKSIDDMDADELRKYIRTHNI